MKSIVSQLQRELAASRKQVVSLLHEQQQLQEQLVSTRVELDQVRRNGLKPDLVYDPD